MLPLPMLHIYVIVERLVSTWCICLTEILEEKDFRLSDYLIKFKVLWLLIGNVLGYCRCYFLL